LAAFGAISLLLALRLPETHPRPARAGITARVIAGNYLHLLRDRRYLGYALTSTMVWAGLYVYVAGAPLVYIRHFGLSPQVFSLIFAMNIVGLIAANFINTRLLRLHQPFDRMLRGGVAGCAAANAALALAAYLGWLPLPLLAALLFVFVALRGFINANAMAGALANHPQRAGAAVALMGALQCATGFAAGAAMSAFNDGTPRPMLTVMAVLGLAALALMVTLLKPRQEVLEAQI
jgi:DHA1 family bicyclomycin/chloramphenicol resistance-like MFS transporter